MMELGVRKRLSYDRLRPWQRMEYMWRCTWTSQTLPVDVTLMANELAKLKLEKETAKAGSKKVFPWVDKLEREGYVLS